MTLFEKQSARKRKSIIYLVERGEYSLGYALLKVEELNDNGKLTEEDYEYLSSYLEELIDRENVVDEVVDNLSPTEEVEEGQPL